MQQLWDYQTADLALTRFESALRKSKTRSRLLAVRKALVQQQNRVKKLDGNLREAYEDCIRIAKEVDTIREQIEALTKEAENCKEQDLRQLRLVLHAMEQSSKALNDMYRQIDKRHALAQSAEAVIKTARVKLTKGKKEFDALKEQHDKELADAAPELTQLRETAHQKEKGISKDLLSKYKKVKRTRVNPVAKVKNDQCSGCNMAIPSLILSRLRSGDGVVECDSCGRILYYTDSEED